MLLKYDSFVVRYHFIDKVNTTHMIVTATKEKQRKYYVPQKKEKCCQYDRKK